MLTGPPVRDNEAVTRSRLDSLVLKLQPQAPLEYVADGPDLTSFGVLKSLRELD